MKKIYYEQVIQDLYEHNLYTLTKKEDYKNTCTMLILTNGVYKTLKSYKSYSSKHAEPQWFSKNNPFIIENINAYLKKYKDDKIVCISNKSDYINRESVLKFKCNRCGSIFESTWVCEEKAISDKYNSRYGILCKKCDGSRESLHALVLKQIFKHEYPDTCLEEKSCINPITNSIMPTDIVNHRLKIAIEIQGQFHDREEQKKRDKIKKDFWINKGYQFFDYKIEKISILDYVRLFFPKIERIPDYVNMDYKNKLDFATIQKYLNQNIRVSEIAKKLNLNPHLIYDAIYAKKLFYPNTYNRKTTVEIVQLSKDGEFIQEYDSILDAEKYTGIKHGLISSCLHTKYYYCKNFYWVYKKDYYTGNYEIPIKTKR